MTSTSIHRIRIESVTAFRPFEPQQELSFRVAVESYDDLEPIANRLLTAWLRANPGKLAIWSISGLSAQELGDAW